MYRHVYKSNSDSNVRIYKVNKNFLSNALIKKYTFFEDSNPSKTYLFNLSNICLGINFKIGDTDYRLIVNNVRSIGKNKNTEKYIPKVEL